MMSYSTNLLAGAKRCRDRRQRQLEFDGTPQQKDKRQRAVNAAERMVAKYESWIEFLKRAKMAIEPSA